MGSLQFVSVKGASTKIVDNFQRLYGTQMHSTKLRGLFYDTGVKITDDELTMVLSHMDPRRTGYVELLVFKGYLSKLKKVY